MLNRDISPSPQYYNDPNWTPEELAFVQRARAVGLSDPSLTRYILSLEDRIAVLEQAIKQALPQTPNLPPE